MKRACKQYLVLILVLISTPGIARAEDRLAVHADTPSVAVSANSSRGNFMRLPLLEFSLRFELECKNESAPVSLLVSVADTRRSVRADTLQSGEDAEIKLEVPADQIAPIALDDFCRTDEQQIGQRVLIPAALSAQASLRCGGETTEQTVYASTPLDVELVCTSDSEPEE